MASSIDASTSGAGGVITTADNTGILQLKSGGTTIATISSTGITTQVGSPAFSAYQGSAQTLSTSTTTKITFDTEEFDTNSNFASSRFTPTVTGYYQVTGGIQVNATACVISLFLYKNGSLYKFLVTSNNSNLSGAYGTSLVYLNGSTDYVEIYASVSVGQALNVNGTASSYFNGAMIRSA